MIKEIEEARASNAELEAEKSALKKRIEEIEDRIDAIQNKTNETNDSILDISTKEDTGRDRRIELKNALSEINMENKLLKKKISNLNSKRSKASLALEKLENPDEYGSFVDRPADV